MSDRRAASTMRLEALDGLRGYAALVVFAHHALVLLYGPLAGVNDHHWGVRPRLVAQALHRVPLAWVFNGAFAVSFFFVLSGFVLTRAMGAAPTPPRVAKLVATRFLRLLPLVVLGTLAGWAVFDRAVLHLDALLMLVGNDSHAYIAPELLEHHGFGQALRQAAVQIWQGSRAERLFDPPLWSIGVELKGSLLVYLFAGSFAQTPRQGPKYVVGALLGTCLMGTDWLPFLAGCYLAERSMRRDGPLVEAGQAKLLLGCALALMWASVHPWDRALWLPLPVNPPLLLNAALDTAAACTLLVAGLQLRALHAALVAGPSQFLGAASYGLYVCHVPLLYLGCGPMMAKLKPAVGTNFAATLTASTLLLASLGLGTLLVRYVDTPAAKRSKAWVGRYFA